MTTEPTPGNVRLNDGLGPVAEGCTPADAAMLRRANHTLAEDVHLLQTALADLHRQVREFVAAYGESDFYTGPALAALAKTGSLDYQWPYSSPTQDEVIAKLLAGRDA